MRSLPTIIFLSFLAFAFFIQCSSYPETTKISSDTSLSYLALGDSYTIGTGITPANNYPHQLSDSLSKRGFIIDTTAVIATNGWTTTDLLEGIQAAEPDSSYDLVSLLIGVNNQYQGLDLDIYRKEFRQLLELAIQFAGCEPSRVWVISIPNYGVTPFAKDLNPIIVRQEVMVYNEIAKEIADEYDIPYVNVTPISEYASEDLSLLASDELHPSAKMYSLWINEMLPTVMDKLPQNE